MPVLTGHHRNYSPIMAKAREIVQSGALGPMVGRGRAPRCSTSRTTTSRSAAAGARQPGGGPILLNLIHEVNNLLSLVGDIVRVQAVTSNATRGFPVEDTAAMVFTFANGALGTFLLSDTAASPALLGADLAGEHQLRQLRRRGLLSHRRHHGVAVRADHAAQGLRRHAVLVGAVRHRRPRPSSAAIRWPTRSTHFAAVIRGEAQPICSGRDGLKTLKVVDAVIEAARTGQPVDITP